MHRVHRRRHQVYEEKDFEIQSLNSLVRNAKKRACETISDPPVELPLHGLTERLAENLQRMHHHLQSLLEKTLGPDARHVIAAERARQPHPRPADEIVVHHHPTIPDHLSEVGNNVADELELLNEYRQRYAIILADLLVVKEKLVELEQGLHISNDEIE